MAGWKTYALYVFFAIGFAVPADCSSSPPPECLNYSTLSEAWRNANVYRGVNLFCDQPGRNGSFTQESTAKWCRFTNLAGSRMADSCTRNNYCGARKPLHLTGGHPTMADGIVNRTVCGTYVSCCDYNVIIQVRLCPGNYYVYRLPPAPVCSATYCGEGTGPVVSCTGISTPRNGQVSGNGTTYKAVRNFTCKTGYVLHGSSSRTCQGDGTWSGTDATCLRYQTCSSYNYVLDESRRTWNDQMKFCQQLNGELAMPKSDAEMSCLDRISTNVDEVWIGILRQPGSPKRDKSSFKYYDSTRLYADRWISGQPGNTATVEECVQFWRTGGNIGWADEECWHVWPVLCQLDINECVTGLHTCSALADCQNTAGSYLCRCLSGYTGNGSSCTDVNECSLGSHNCSSVATCSNLNGSYACECIMGYTGIGWECVDVHECQDGAHACSPNGDCTNTAGSYTCTCQLGYTGDGLTCTDYDECNLGYHDCHVDAACINSPGEFVCNCTRGYTGNGSYCIDVDECSSSPCLNRGTCTNLFGGYSCQCQLGYTGWKCQTNINGCLSLPCKHDGLCTDLVDNFTCSCNAGYTDKFCETDIFECSSSPCVNGYCKDLVSQYQCVCRPGYTGRHCQTNINECSGESKCANGGRCVDGINQNHCNCSGTSFHGPHCNVQVNNCEQHNCVNGATCLDSPSAYTCQCVTGFTGQRCQDDINECELNPLMTPCHTNGTCLNLIGYNGCQCKAGFSGDGVRCDDINECTSTNNKCDQDADCENTIGSYTCHCKSGYRDALGDGSLCRDQNECRASIRSDATDCDVPERAACANTIGSYSCQCLSGFLNVGQARRKECIVPATINTLITTLTVYEGEHVSLPCQVSGFPFPNKTAWCRGMPDVSGHGSCRGNFSNVTQWNTRWTEQMLSNPIPSGILLLETSHINIIDDNSEFVCFTSNNHSLTELHKISISIVRFRDFLLSANIREDVQPNAAQLQAEVQDVLLAGFDVELRAGKVEYPVFNVEALIGAVSLRKQLGLDTLTSVSRHLQMFVQQRIDGAKQRKKRATLSRGSSFLANTVTTRSYDSCDNQTLMDLKGTFYWPDTRIGQTRIIFCPVEQVGFETARAVRVCGKSADGLGAWETANTSACPFESQKTQQLQELATVSVATTPGKVDVIEVQEVSEQVKILTKPSGAQSLTEADVEFTTKLLLDLATAMSATSDTNQERGVERNIRKNVVTAVSQLMEAPPKLLTPSQSTPSTRPSRKIVQALELLVESVPVAQGESTTTISKNVAVGVVCPSVDNGAVFTSTAVLPEPAMSSDHYGYNISVREGATLSFSQGLSVGFVMPSDALKLAASWLNGSSNSSSRLCPGPSSQFIKYINTKLFEDNQHNSSSDFSIGSKIVTAQLVRELSIENLTTPVEMKFAVGKEEDVDKKKLCSFWDDGSTPENTTLSRWSQRGCMLVDGRTESATEYVYTCRCTHLTSFAMLMAPSSKLPSASQEALSKITYVGCSLSIAGLLATLFFTLSNRHLRRKRHQKLLAGLCFSLLLAVVMFIVGVEVAPHTSKEECNIVGILLHVFLLQSFIWMSAMAVNIGLDLILIFSTAGEKVMKITIVLVLTVPCLIVIVTAYVAGLDVYHKDSNCWLNNTGAFFASFCAPLALMVIGNAAILVASLRGMIRRRRMNIVAAKNVKVIKAVVSFSFLMGVTWIFGLLLLANNNVALQYVFTLLNSLQGFFIFIFFAVTTKKVETGYNYGQSSSPVQRQHIGRAKTRTVTVSSLLFSSLKRRLITATTGASTISSLTAVQDYSSRPRNASKTSSQVCLATTQHGQPKQSRWPDTFDHSELAPFSSASMSSAYRKPHVLISEI